MKLDTATLAFGYIVKVGGGTPNWATSLGQSQINEYKINDYDDINEILKGIVYKSKPLDKISSKIGKGGKEVFGNSDNSPIILGAVFTKIEINNVLIPNGKFILLITRDDSESHKGRLRLKYGPSNKYSDGNYVISNETFFTEAKKTLGLADNACWFISELTVKNQDTLKLKAIIVNKNHSVEYEDTKQLHDDWKKLESPLLDISDKSTNFVPQQIIFYGVPGCGKSFKIDNEKTKDAADIQKQKVVFHPDYTNSDFVGQIIPRMKETGEGASKKTAIEYSFKPGPFTTILRRALRDKERQYFLLIEEINRGNAAAIFGDLFQLLDRDENGWSCSPVNNDDINFYVASKYEFWEENYSDSHEYDAECVNHPNGTEPFSRNTGIRLPSNLSIYATMNTNDQNVFTLDNAFNRRFKSEYISNKENPEIPEHCRQFNLMIGETGIRWGAFRNKINEKIIQTELANAEDKQLGLFFIKSENSKINEKDFADKVLKYLWHDVFKRDKDIFDGRAEISKFEDLIDNFKGKDAFENCFDEDFVESIKEINKDFAKVQNESHAELLPVGRQVDSNVDIDSESSSE